MHDEIDNNNSNNINNSTKSSQTSNDNGDGEKSLKNSFPHFGSMNLLAYKLYISFEQPSICPVLYTWAVCT